MQVTKADKSTCKPDFYTCFYPLAILWALSLLISCKGKTGNESRLPNIVVIMADDLGYGDLGCYGNTAIRTPHLDSLAAHGLRFTDFHSNGVVCSPTRASLLSGRYPQECGISGVITAKDHRHVGLSPDETLIPEFLKSYGYSSGIMGKWHLGYDTTYSPVAQGFDIFKGFTSGNVDYISHFDQENHFDWWLNKQLSDQEGYLTDLITSNALSFIAQHKDHPFFLYVAHGAPHSPYQNRRSAPIRNGTVSATDIEASPEQKKELYREMIEIMDEGVGKVIAALKRHDLLDNTLVLFLSDNGATKTGSNAPFKGHKGQVWEGGHRVPAIACWKGTIRPGVSEALVTTMDIFPTIAGLIGADSAETPLFSGVSFAGLLTGKGSELSGRPLYWAYRNGAAVREGDWKLVRQEEQYYLYNLRADPSESADLSASHPEKVSTLSQLLNEWLKKMESIPMKS